MEHLVLAVVGNYQPDLANEITKLVHSCECNISDCHILKMGQQLVATLLVTGNWSGLAKCENMIPAFEKKNHVHVIAERTEADAYPPDVYPYTVYVIGKAEL